MGSLFNPEKGTWVLACFIAFFSVVVAVNTVYITSALGTFSGVVTDDPYEKGLAFDKMLAQERDQPKLRQQASYENGRLRWILKDERGQPLKAHVSARLFRPVQEGYDFEVVLDDQGEGVYEIPLDLPLEGRWIAQLKAQWDTSQYQLHLPFIAR